jgi:conjugative transposon protein TcpC
VRRPAALSRVVGLAPRALALVAIGMLALLGLRGLVQGGSRTVRVLAPPAPAAEALPARALAERFARAYLSWDPRRPSAREDALAGLASPDLGPGAGLSPPATGPAQRVRFTQVVDERAGAGGTRVVTVATRTSRETVYLAVPVLVAPDGALALVQPPALVGPPLIDIERTAPDEAPVEDPALAEVARRAVLNYLTGDRANLVADLAPGASVVMPRPLAALSVERVSWADRARGLVSVAVRAALSGGARAELRYELAVVDQGRWLVQTVEAG